MNFFASFTLTRGLLAVIAGLFVLLGIYAYRVDIQEAKLEVCQADTRATQIIIKANEVKYKEHIKHYDAAILDTVKFYDEKLKEIDSFKEDTHETKCENAQRLLDGFRY